VVKFSSEQLLFVYEFQEKLLPNISRMWEGYPHTGIPYVSFANYISLYICLFSQCHCTNIHLCYCYWCLLLLENGCYQASVDLILFTESSKCSWLEDKCFVIVVDFGSSSTSLFSWHIGYTHTQNCTFRKLRR